jgi:hypothetical protein
LYKILNFYHKISWKLTWITLVSLRLKEKKINITVNGKPPDTRPPHNRKTRLKYKI